MKISVITPSYNQALFIGQAIQSVISQHYPNLEYIIADGKSTDSSAEVISVYQQHIQHFIHEKDNGQAHALNKGFSLAGGDIFCWLNADDVFLPGTFEKVSGYFETHPECQWLAGDCIFSDIFLNPVWNYTVLSTSAKDYLRFWDDMYLAQPSVFFRKELWQKSGGLNETLHYALDHELWLRFFRISPLHHIPEPLSVNRVYPQTKTSTGNEKSIKELSAVLKEYNTKIGAGYQDQQIEKKLRSYFIAGEMSSFRSRNNEGIERLFSYSLSLKQKVKATASMLKTLFSHW